MSAATAYAANSNANLSTQAKAVTAAYGFVDGTNNVTVTINNPPIAPPSCSSQSAVYSGNTSAIEMVVAQPQPPIFSSIWVRRNYGLCGRSVALIKGAGDGCIIGLDSTAPDTVLVNNNAMITNSNCKV